MKTILVRVTAFVVVVVVANLYNRLQIRAESSTRSEMRVIATALEQYASVHCAYPTFSGAAAFEDGVRCLEPTFVAKLPRWDGWGRPLVIESDVSDYTVTSYGKGGLSDAIDPVRRDATGATKDLRGDFELERGAFSKDWSPGYCRREAE